MNVGTHWVIWFHPRKSLAFFTSMFTSFFFPAIAGTLLHFVACYRCWLIAGIVWSHWQNGVPLRKTAPQREVKISTGIISFLETGAPPAPLVWDGSCQFASSVNSFVDAGDTINLTMINRTLDVYHVVLFEVSGGLWELMPNLMVVSFCSAPEGWVGEEEEDEGEEGKRMDRKLLGGHQPGPPWPWTQRR